MGRRTRLTSELIEAIAQRVRAGSFAYVAAQSVGVPKSTFYRWMASGEGGGGGLYRELWDKVSSASAQARHEAETRVFKERPLEWLRLGPGREGWCDTSTAVASTPAQPPKIQYHNPVSPRLMADALKVLYSLGIISVVEGKIEFSPSNAADGFDEDDRDELPLLTYSHQRE